MTEVIASITLILIVAFIFGEILYHLKFPRIIGYILAGSVIALTPLNKLITSEVAAVMDAFSKMGIVFLLLIAGMELNISKFEKGLRHSLIISLFTTFVPFILGIVIGQIFHFSIIVSIILGALLAVTAEGTTATLLLSEGLINTRIGTYILSAGIIDDIIEIFLISLISLLMASEVELPILKNVSHISLFPLFFVIIILLIFAIIRGIPRIFNYIKKERDKIADLSLLIIITFLLASFSETLSFGYAIGAFFAGVLIQKITNQSEEQRLLEEDLKMFTLAFIIPFFFVNIGLHFTFEGILSNLPLFLLIFLAGIGGKFGGALLSKFFVPITWDQAALIGWAMNSRGAIELVAIELLRQANSITPSLYSSIVAMTIISTTLFPIFLKIALRKNPNIMK